MVNFFIKWLISTLFTFKLYCRDSWKKCCFIVFFNINNFLLNRKLSLILLIEPTSQAVWLNYDLASVFCWTLLVKWTRQLWSKPSKSDGRSSWRSLGGKVLLSTISWSPDQPPPLSFILSTNQSSPNNIVVCIGNSI